MDPTQLKEQIIIPAITDLEEVIPGCASSAAVNLLLGTVAQESAMGEYLIQKGEGIELEKAISIYQMERPTHDDIWNHYLRYKTEIQSFMLKTLTVSDAGEPKSQQLMWDMRYATLMARIHYWRVSEALPHQNDIASLGRYWKKYYNTKKGHGTIAQFVKNYNIFIL